MMFEMNEAKEVSVLVLARRFFGTVLAVFLILPLLLVAELVCMPEVVSNWLWDLGDKFIGGSGK